MKKSTKCLFALLLMLGAMLEMKAADVYLLTAEKINGVVGKYAVPSNHQLAPSTSYGSNVYSLKITSMPETGFWFRIGVSGGGGNQMQPKVNGDPLTINEEGTQDPTSYSIESDCYGSSNAWKVSYTADEYEYLTVNVDITNGTTHRVWIEGKKVSAGGSGGPVVLSATDIEPGYYLVGNFFSPHNKGGEFNPGGDGETIDYENHVYFKFEEQKDKSYAFSIPACLTAHAQILAVDEYDHKMVYGPGEVFNLHGAKDNDSALPSTNEAVGTICGTTEAKKLVGSATIEEGKNYWNLVTRNDGVTDDDGMYTFSFTLDKNGNPSDWQVKHDATRCVTYLIGNMEGATAQPLYDKRKSGGNEGPFDNDVEASLYFDGKNSYWAIDFIVNTVTTQEILDQAKKATPDIHATKSVGDCSGTHDKLFFLGNGGYPYSHDDKHDKVWTNQKPFTLQLYGIKRIQYNPTRGDNGLSAQDGSYGLSGSIRVMDGGANDADILIKTMSMIGDAVEGTYDAATRKWMYTSTAGDMKYDANERCFSLTISTVGDKYKKSHFRFVANNDAHQNWGETDGNITSNTGFARPTYDAADDGNHSCMADDPNDVQFRKTAREDEEGFESTTPSQKDILWNRPEGIWTVRFYPELDEKGNDISRYTISGTKVIKIPFTRCVGKFIRTYSNNVAMAPVNDNVKVYEAYRYEKTENAKDPQSQGTVYLRQLKYIPANMGVVLVGKQPAEGTFSDVDKLDFFLREAPADMLEEGDNYKAVWTKADDYVNDEWNNYLQPTVTAIDNLGNADTDDNGKILHRFFGLANFHSTNYYKQYQTGDDYIGFFRLTPNGKSGANKAYLSIPANAVIDGGVGAKFGYIDFNGQFLGNETDDPNNPSLAKMAIVFDDEDDGGSTTTVTEVKPNSTDDNASFYTLQGVKVSRPVKGVYIHNGKKFIK